MPPASGQYVTAIAACTRDVTKFCHATHSDRNLLAECIESHFQDFNERCRTALVRTAAVREACKADIEQQCPTERPGAGRILLCVKKRFAALGQSCKDAISPRGRAQSWVLLSIRPRANLISLQRLSLSLDPYYVRLRGDQP